MDSTFKAPRSASDLARELGTSVPRVTRAARRLGLSARRSNGRYAFTSAQARSLADALGATPPIEGLSRTEAIALATLRNAPLGLVSARALARRAGLSPTAAGRALRTLRDKGLVERSVETAAAGRAREMQIWRANPRHPSWPALDPALDRVRRPTGPASRKSGAGLRDGKGGSSAEADRRVPRRLRHLFWNTAASQLDVRRAGPYIATRLLREMDLQGLAWGAKNLTREDWRRAARARGLDPEVRRLALNLVEAAR